LNFFEIFTASKKKFQKKSSKKKFQKNFNKISKKFQKKKSRKSDNPIIFTIQFLWRCVVGVHL